MASIRLWGLYNSNLWSNSGAVICCFDGNGLTYQIKEETYCFEWKAIKSIRAMFCWGITFKTMDGRKLTVPFVGYNIIDKIVDAAGFEKKERYVVSCSMQQIIFRTRACKLWAGACGAIAWGR